MASSADHDSWDYAVVLIASCRDRDEFAARRSATDLAHHRAFAEWLVSNGDGEVTEVDGFCWACAAPSVFTLKRRGQFQVPPSGPNWREGLQCRHCGMSNRVRAMCWFTDHVVDGRPEPQIYAMEQDTPFFRWLASRYGEGAVGSEHLGDGLEPGTMVDGTRHEDVEALSFTDEAFDLVISMDCLEHVNEPARAIAEVARVTKADGEFLLSVPFFADARENVRRAERRGDDIVHHQPAIYHGDPPPAYGWLVFWDYGWALVDELRRHFASVELVLFQSRLYTHLGPNLSVFRCVRGRESGTARQHSGRLPGITADS